jgi:hypothetical protein
MPTAGAEDTAQSCMIGFGQTQRDQDFKLKNQFKRSRSAGPSFYNHGRDSTYQTGKTVQTN